MGEKKKRLFEGLEKIEGGKRGKDAGFVGKTAKEFNGLYTVLAQSVMDVNRKVIPDRRGRKADTRSPFANEVVDMGQPVITRADELLGQLHRGEMFLMQDFGPYRPHRSDPRQSRAKSPLVREIEPLARANGIFNLCARFQGKQRGIADQQSGIGMVKHGKRVGMFCEESGRGPEKVAEQHFGVGT